jgi:uncharacterized protein YceH (UPF0502 family)
MKARLQQVVERDGTNVNRLVVGLIEAFLDKELPEEGSIEARVSALEELVSQLSERLSRLESKP